MKSLKYHVDEKRAYAIRCPSCHLATVVVGSTLNTDKYIKCPNCGAISRTDTWIRSSQIVRNTSQQ